MSTIDQALARLSAGQPVRVFVGNGLDMLELKLTPSAETKLRRVFRDDLEIQQWNRGRGGQKEGS
ncbi:hypothetical protein JYU29_05835 [Tianweitania sp. BSSL-BM11]|uniref:Uncharacterized protein n=1 Tax=Tianweitania aestuarii TaxID=2814886 RepID=A0ABS5RX03_9HYPH|nr:hypothetical protein [Tianweitania aestuarii]MBS9720207.1 hypothetical protein [Tianweitania aestuarii]